MTTTDDKILDKLVSLEEELRAMIGDAPDASFNMNITGNGDSNYSYSYSLPSGIRRSNSVSIPHSAKGIVKATKI